MSTVPESFDLYRQAWNETDPERIRPLLEKAVAPDVLFVDPANTTQGIDELETMILRTHQAMPGAQYLQASGIDGHNNRYRYRWEVMPNPDTVIPGMDFVTLDDQERLQRIDGFFGDFAPQV